MDKKHAGITAVILAILLALVYSQFRMWKNFDWSLFLAQTHSVSKFHILHGIALIYLAYVLRAVRWKIFLRPLRPQAPTTSLVLLGRPGELIRPYLIARQQKLPFSSQLAVWAVERIFDIAGFTFLFVLAAFVAAAPKRLEEVGFFHKAAGVLVLLVIGLTVGAIVIHRSGEMLASWAERSSARRGSEFGLRVAMRIREFRGGLNTIHDKKSFLMLIGASVLMWAIIAVAYKEVTHAYGSACNEAALSDVCKLRIPQTQV